MDKTHVEKPVERHRGERSCSSCAKSGQIESQLVCRANPPTATSVVVIAGIDPVGKLPVQQIRNQALYPPVREDDWCCQYSNRL